MPANPTPKLQTPHQKAILGTVIAFVLLAIFGIAGYWYGKKGATSPSTATTNTNTATSGLSTGTTAIPKTVIAGVITKVLGGAIEISSGSGDTAQTITAKVVDGTTFRKLDLRTIPKNGVGDGTAISFKELKVGNQVVVDTADATASTINASKVSLVIYP